jgi:hypothetical protein
MPGSGGMACLCVTAELAVAAINDSENSLKLKLLSFLDLCRMEVGQSCVSTWVKSVPASTTPIKSPVATSAIA